jgi:chitodextrinase
VLDSRPETPRRVLHLAAATAVLMAVFATGHARPAEAPAPSQGLSDVWALEVTPELANPFGPRLLARARDLGINTIVLSPQLSPKQERRMRSLARRFHLLAFQPRRLVCKRETVETCAVVARTPEAVKRLARERYVDIVVLRMRGPTRAPELSRNRETATAGATTARLMLLPTLTARPRFSRRSWRRAISAVAEAQTVSLGVTPTGRSGRRAFELFLRILASKRLDKDTAPPSVPSGIRVFESTRTTISVSWNAASDKVGVKTYSVYRNGASVGTTPSRAFTIAGLDCGTVYALAVEAFDAAGNRSGSTSVWAATATCAPPLPSPLDKAPPSPPSGLKPTGVTRTSVSLSWNAATDDVGVVSYRVYRNGSSVGTTVSQAFTIAGLTCGKTYALAVDASDAAGNHSAPGSVSVATAVCAPPPPPPPLPPPTPPPPPPIDVGAIVFNGDFETGDHKQWTWGAQCANTGVPSDALAIRGTITVQSAIVGQGRYGARIDLPAAPDGKSACETVSKRQIGLGTDDYYGLMVRFPSGWREPSSAEWGLALAQFNFQNIWGAPVILIAHANHIALVLQSGLCNPADTSNPGCAYSSGAGGNVKPLVAVPAPLTTDAWHELIIHVRWATDSSGVLEAWHRVKGSGSWRKTVLLSGYPTVQWTANRGPQAIANLTTSDKIGAYRGKATFPLSVWHDGFVRTTSFAAAAAPLP